MLAQLKVIYALVKAGGPGTMKVAVVFLCIYGASGVGLGLLLSFIFWLVSLK
jgi:hypothetical protein